MVEWGEVDLCWEPGKNWNWSWGSYQMSPVCLDITPVYIYIHISNGTQLIQDYTYVSYTLTLNSIMAMHTCLFMTWCDTLVIIGGSAEAFVNEDYINLGDKATRSVLSLSSHNNDKSYKLTHRNTALMNLLWVYKSISWHTMINYFYIRSVLIKTFMTKIRLSFWSE